MRLSSFHGSNELAPLSRNAASVTRYGTGRTARRNRSIEVRSIFFPRTNVRRETRVSFRARGAATRDRNRRRVSSRRSASRRRETTAVRASYPLGGHHERTHSSRIAIFIFPSRGKNDSPRPTPVASRQIFRIILDGSELF